MMIAGCLISFQTLAIMRMVFLLLISILICLMRARKALKVNRSLKSPVVHLQEVAPGGTNQHGTGVEGRAASSTQAPSSLATDVSVSGGISAFTRLTPASARTPPSPSWNLATSGDFPPPHRTRRSVSWFYWPRMSIRLPRGPFNHLALAALTVCFSAAASTCGCLLESYVAPPKQHNLPNRGRRIHK